MPRRLDVTQVAPDRAISRTVDRRSVLRAAGGSAVAALALGAVTACSDDQPVPRDVLVAQEESARTDAVWAKAAVATAPDRTAALQVIAAQRTEHADALRTEIDRAIGAYGDGTRPESAAQAGPPVPAPAAPAPPPTIDALRARLTDSQHSAARLAATRSGYRAGLLASISACCATHVVAQLA